MKSIIPLTPVTSSKLNAIGFDADRKVLAVQFFGKDSDGQKIPGTVYEYQNVDPEKFDRLRHAPSIGSFFIHEIQNQREAHPYLKMVEEEEKEAA